MVDSASFQPHSGPLHSDHPYAQSDKGDRPSLYRLKTDKERQYGHYPQKEPHKGNLTQGNIGVKDSVSVERLSVRYRSVEALRDITLTVPPGQLVGVFGPNGAGKSTLIKAMLGLIPAAAGMVSYGDRPLAHQLDRIAYVPQRSQIDWTFPVTVWDVVLMGRTKKAGYLSRLSTVSRRIAAQALERVGMAEYRNRRIGDLSGGQQQRVFLARSLAQEAELFFFDEPFVGVDQKTETLLFGIFREMADAGKTVWVVNHDLGESIANFDRLILLNQDLIATGTRQEVLTQENMARAYGGHIQFYAA